MTPMPDTHIPDRLLSIGQLARESGLSASALRFYDREGVLVPADVDPVTGYRRYAVAQVRAARLLASLRRVGMPLPEVALVLDEDARGTSGVAADVVAAHEQRLVDGLADARREIRRTLALLAEDATGDVVRRVTVRARDLVDALASVRFAVAPGVPVAGASDGPDLRVLTGVLLEVGDGPVGRSGGAPGREPSDRMSGGTSGGAGVGASGMVLRCVATDRYRLAVGCVPLVGSATTTARPASAVVPVDWADQVAQACEAQPSDAEVALELGEGRVGVRVAGELLATPSCPGRSPTTGPSSTRPPRRGVADASGLLARLPHEVESVGLLVRDGAVSLAPTCGRGPAAAADVFVDPEFLREALAVVGPHPRLELDGHRRPLAIRGDGPGFSVLMPVAPDGLSS